ncbi:carbohydrate-binding domain-containing protein [Microbacterium sp. G2-8]|uniref:carbohydrate-binding domain-containing protein n=1 Tax=Microbacterium sp. G2-8 TaxID=2842454 RepID=UPI001C8A1D7A|nr:carbohydrate-binding domain-containing protein [Microbacterium sp. G2-8]
MTTTPPRRPRSRSLGHVAAGLGLTFSLGIAALTGCSAIAEAASSESTSSTEAATSTETKPESVAAVVEANADQTVVNDDEWSAADAQAIALSGEDAATDASGVRADDGSVTITEAGVYRLSGDYDGSVVIDADEEAQVVLILDGVTIDADGVPAIQSVSADDVAIFLESDSTNAVSSTGTYDEDAEANAAIFADNDLTFSGGGALTVDGEANDAITSKDDLVVLSGTIDVTATDDGLRGKDSLTVRGAAITVDAGGDGLTSDQDDDETQGWVLIEGGSLDITAGSDGLDGFTDVVITDGELAIASEEGIEAGTVAIGGGTIDIVASDDGINGSAGTADSAATDTATTDTDETPSEADTAAGSSAAAPADPPSGEMPDGGFPGGETPADGEMPEGGGMPGGGGMQDTGEWVLIAGGDITIDAEGDGLDSNGSLEITGGTTIVDGPSNGGNGALDANGEITVSGGTLLALDAGGMSETPSADSAQAWVAATASGDADATIEIVADDGTVLYSGKAEKAFGAVVYSGEDVVAGETYTVTVDGSEAVRATAGEALAGGMGGPQG